MQTSLSLEPAFVQRKAFHVLGIVTRITVGAESGERFAEIWRAFELRRAEIEPYSTDHRYYGVSFPTPEANTFDYIAGMAVEPAATVPAGFAVREIPDASYAVFACSVSTIGPTYQHIFGEWRARSGHVIDTAAPGFEEYPPAGDSVSPVLIHVPITVSRQVPVEQGGPASGSGQNQRTPPDDSSTAEETRSNRRRSEGSRLTWSIEKVVNYPEEKPWGQGYGHYGFHDCQGNRYFFDYFHHWVGCLGEDDEFRWTAGVRADVKTGFHIDADFLRPMFLTESPDGLLLISCDGNARIFSLDLERRLARLFLDAGALGLKDISSTVYDFEGNLWISEITGCRIWRLDRGGTVIETLGDGQPGFQAEAVSFEHARFRWIYVMKRGPDGCLYVLDSTNFAIRKVNTTTRMVETVVGTGKPGYTGDGGDAREATLGGDPGERFNGPYGLCVDEHGNLFIADTCNHVVRMVDASTNVISTIAGRHAAVAHLRNDPHENDPFKLNLPKLSALDYHRGRLFVPEWDGDLIILNRLASE